MRILILSLSVFLAGCATNHLEERKAEKAIAYEALAPEVKALVDQGTIKEGMTEDAVYVAWGEPSEVTHGETEAGRVTTWFYKGTYYQEHRYWAFRAEETSIDYFHRPEGPIRSRRLQRDFVPRDYIKADVKFVNGVVATWRVHPKPK